MNLKIVKGNFDDKVKSYTADIIDNMERHLLSHDDTLFGVLANGVLKLKDGREFYIYQDIHSDEDGSDIENYHVAGCPINQEDPTTEEVKEMEDYIYANFGGDYLYDLAGKPIPANII